MSKGITVSKRVYWLAVSIIVIQWVWLALLLAPKLPSLHFIADRLQGTRTEVIVDTASGKFWGLRVSGYNGDDSEVLQEWARFRLKKIKPPSSSLFTPLYREREPFGIDGRYMTEVYFQDPMGMDFLPEGKKIIVPLKYETMTPKKRKKFRIVSIHKTDSTRGYKLVAVE